MLNMLQYYHHSECGEIQWVRFTTFHNHLPSLRPVVCSVSCGRWHSVALRQDIATDTGDTFKGAHLVP